MKWLPMALLALTKIPLEKIFVRQPDPMKKVERLESMVTEKKQAESPVSEPAPQQHPAEIPIAWLAVLGLHSHNNTQLLPFSLKIEISGPR